MDTGTKQAASRTSQTLNWRVSLSEMDQQLSQTTRHTAHFRKASGVSQQVAGRAGVRRWTAAPQRRARSRRFRRAELSAARGIIAACITRGAVSETSGGT